MSTPISRILGVLVAAIVMFACQGCKDPDAEDKAAIRKLVREYDAANEERQGKAVVEMMTQATLDRYTSLVRIGLDGSEAEARRLPAFERFELFRMRTRATRKDLKGKDGRAYQIWATDQGWYASGEEDYESMTDGMSDIKIDIDHKGGWCYLKEDGKRTKYMLRFEKPGDRWQFDESSFNDYFDDWTKSLAAMLGESQDDLLMDMVEEEAGIEIDRKAIWKPMKK